jgi:hypothetical protein
MPAARMWSLAFTVAGDGPVVKAVKTDRVELVVMPGPGRLMRAIMDYLPGSAPR